MIISALLQIKREIKYGPEDPTELVKEYYAAINKRLWLFYTADYIGMALSGMMVLFLASVFCWRRSLVNRVSLRLIFVMSFLDFAQSIFVTQTMKPGNTRVVCRALTFCVEYCAAVVVYLSAAIAFNLQMVFLRKSRKPLPKYVEYLYFIVPFTVALLHQAPQMIWAAKHGFCSVPTSFSNLDIRFPIYIVFGLVCVHGIFVLYGLITSIRVIITLYKKQLKISRALNEASHETTMLLNGTDNPNTSTDGNNGSRRSSLSSKEINQLQAVRNVYRACIRIALYPLTPFWWWVYINFYYLMQYGRTMTFRSDLNRILKLSYITWLSFPIVIVLNFTIFLTDPAVLHIVSVVRKEVKSRFIHKKSIEEFQTEYQFGSSSGSLTKKDNVSISEFTDSMTINDETSLNTSEHHFDNEHETGAPVHADGALEEGLPRSRVIDDFSEDSIMRLVQTGANVKDVYTNV